MSSQVRAIRLFLTVVCSFISLASGLEAAHAANYTVTYDSNNSNPLPGITSGNVPTSTSYASGSTVTVAANSGALARQGFTFAGWNTNATALSALYTAGSGTFTINADTTLYAIWIIPQSARLIGSGGSVVTISNPNSVSNGANCTAGNIRGVTSDGTYMYFRPSSFPGWICKLTMAGVVVSANNVGTVLANTIPSDSMALAYSSGCIFVRDSGAATSTIYCIDVSDWSITARTLPTSLYAGQGWGTGNVITFPDGRFGAVSAPNVGDGLGTCPTGMHCKILRLYNVIGTGKSVTFTTSEDIYLADPESGWPGDDHGIATDGTYLYEIMFNSGYKVWALRSGVASYLVFNGSGAGACGATSGVTGTMCGINMPIDGTTALLSNATYIGHNHTTGTYMMGDYSAAKIYISDSFLPPAGPGSLPASASFTSFGLSSGLSTAIYRTNNQLIVNLNTPSKVTFFSKGKPIPGCKNILSSGTSPSITASCSWKPAAHGYVYITATATPTNNAIASGSAPPLLLLVSPRSGKR